MKDLFVLGGKVTDTQLRDTPLKTVQSKLRALLISITSECV